jgi:phage anti-repressor protein
MFLSLLVMLILSGCNLNDTNINNGIFQFKDSFVGDNSAVGNITNQLPSAEQLKGFELKTNEEPYGIILNYDWIESEQEYKETVVYNATFLFALVQNVDWITFDSGNREYTIMKENLQKWYGKELSVVQSEDELKELLQEYLKDENKVNELLR